MEVTSLLSSTIIILSLGLIFVLLLYGRTIRVTKTLLFSDFKLLYLYLSLSDHVGEKLKSYIESIVNEGEIY